jgi:large subunit ribosomal protein L15
MRKKTSKNRGSHTNGYGAKKKHRGKGSRGGKGLANIFKHKKVWARVKRPDLFERNTGFASLRMKGIKPYVKALNVCDLEGVLRGVDLKKEVDLGELGYDKLLGGGSINFPVKVRVSAFTERAEQKIQKAGGQISTDERTEKA